MLLPNGNIKRKTGTKISRKAVFRLRSSFVSKMTLRLTDTSPTQLRHPDLKVKKSKNPVFFAKHEVSLNKST